MNLNIRVRVTLTKHGLAVLMARHTELFKDFPAAKRPDTPPGLSGYVMEGPLWELMSEFGPSIHMGCKQLFERNEIELLESI